MNIQSAGSTSVELTTARRTATESTAGTPARADGAVATGSQVQGSAVRAAASDRAARTDQAPSEAPAGSGQTEREQVDVAVDSLNEFVASVQRDIRFQVDDLTGQAIVQVIDRKSETVVRQIPSELALQLARQVKEDASINLLTATS